MKSNPTIVTLTLSEERLFQSFGAVNENVFVASNSSLAKCLKVMLRDTNILYFRKDEISVLLKSL